MTTLTTAPLVGLLDQLFADAEATKTAFVEQMGGLSAEARQALMRDTDPCVLYTRARNVHLSVSRETATLLYLLARGCRARVIVEFGASFGVSTLHLAAALQDNGGGRLVSSEFEPSKVAHARANLARAGLSAVAEVREGDALQTLSRDLPPAVDLLFLDGAKPHYRPVLALVEPHLRPRGRHPRRQRRRQPDVPGIRSRRRPLLLDSLP